MKKLPKKLPERKRRGIWERRGAGRKWGKCRGGKKNKKMEKKGNKERRKGVGEKTRKEKWRIRERNKKGGMLWEMKREKGKEMGWTKNENMGIGFGNEGGNK